MSTRSILVALLTAGAAAAAVPPAFATTITPTTTADVVDPGDGKCSLREAIPAANSNTASGPLLTECPAGEVGEDVINLVAGTFDLSLAGAGEDGNASGDLDAASGQVLRRFPNLKLATDQVEWHQTPVFRGVRSLPVEF